MIEVLFQQFIYFSQLLNHISVLKWQSIFNRSASV